MIKKYILVTTIAIAIMPFFASADYAEEETTFLGNSWSYSCKFIFDGEGAEIVTWDFGDEKIYEGFEIEYRFQEKGLNYFTQTAINHVGITTKRYSINIMGYPDVTYDYNYDGIKEIVKQTEYNTKPILPETPQREGYIFKGWFMDSNCNLYLKPDTKIIEPTTLYAGWDAINTNSYNSDKELSEDKKTNSVIYITLILGVGMFSSALYLKSKRIAYISAIPLLVSLLIFLGMIF